MKKFGYKLENFHSKLENFHSNLENFHSNLEKFHSNLEKFHSTHLLWNDRSPFLIAHLFFELFFEYGSVTTVVIDVPILYIWCICIFL